MICGRACAGVGIGSPGCVGGGAAMASIRPCDGEGPGPGTAAMRPEAVRSGMGCRRADERIGPVFCGKSWPAPSGATISAAERKLTTFTSSPSSRKYPSLSAI